MRSSPLLLLALAASLAATAIPARAADSAAAIPAEQFFQRLPIVGATISPDGRHVAVRQLSSKGRLELAIVDIAARSSKPIVSAGNADVRWAYWVSDKRLVFTVNNLYRGGEMRNSGVYAVDVDGKHLKGLSPTIERGRSFAEDTHRAQALQRPDISGFSLPTEDMTVVIDYSGELEIGRMDTRTGMATPIVAPRATFSLLLDPAGKAQIASARRSGRHVVFQRGGFGWEELTGFEPDSPEALQPALYADGGMYVTARNGSDTAAFYFYDLKNKKLGSGPLITAPGFDVDGQTIVDDKALLGYSFVTDAQTTVWFDPALKALQQEVDQLLPATANSIARGRQSTTPYVLIDSWSDLQPHEYSVYNRDTKERVLLAAPAKGFKPDQMAETSMARYKARDGLDIPVYVTVPAGADKKKLPTVVLVGSQPWSRETAWDWNPEAQFLATRGYVVLQPQTRGMQGFGLRHANAGNLQWGLAMQDDLADAVRWSVAEGHTDASRVCIAGTGYGGYAAMMGLVKDADVYRCGISWSGITDLHAMFDSGWDHFIRADQERTLARLVGDPRRDAARFKQTSPLHNAARITRPVLLAYGTTDKAVPYEDGKKFYEAVRAGNPDVEWLSYTPTVEDWTTQKNRIDLWRNIERFLARHLAGN
jgi:dipeptidyl aminopeptidase/acylaminoacyl peptidase